MRLWHGGIPGLKPGELIQPGSNRPVVPGCAHCEANARGEATSISPLTKHQDRIYITTNRLYAKHYASLYGRGDLYRVEPVGELVRSDEDSIETYTVAAARVVSVYDRAVQLSWSERRRLFREWDKADMAVSVR